MPSKLAEAFIEITAKMDKLQDSLNQNSKMLKDHLTKNLNSNKEGNKAVEKEGRRFWDSTNDIMKKMLGLSAKTFQSSFRLMGSIAAKFKNDMVSLFQNASNAFRSFGYSAMFAAGTFAYFASQGEWPHARILQMQFQAISNEILMALMPAIVGLFPVLERFRAIIYQHRSVFTTFGIVAVKAINGIATVLNFILGLWDQMNPRVRDFIVQWAPLTVTVAMLYAKFSFLLPIVSKLALLALGFGTPWATAAAGVVAFVAAIIQARDSVQWGETVVETLEKIGELLTYFKGVALDCLARIWSRIQPVWQEFQDFAVAVFYRITTWVDENKETFREWANIVADIIANLVSITIGTWQSYVEYFEGAMNFIGEITGVTWNDVKEAITSVLEWVALVTSNFSLTMRMAWVSIQIGALTAWDAIKDSFWTVVAAVGGGFMAIVAGARTAWDNIQNYFSGAPMQSVSEQMGRSFGEAFDSIIAGRISTNREAINQLMTQLNQMNNELNRGRNDQRNRANQAAQNARDQRENNGNRRNGEPGAPPPVLNVKIEMIGLKDLHKKIQEQISGTSMIGLARRQAQAAEEQNRIGNRIAVGVEALNNNRNNAGPARAG